MPHNLLILRQAEEETMFLTIDLFSLVLLPLGPSLVYCLSM